ncbi:hypothetical protein [Streptomyces brasiliensis]|uniref:Uncharacterized protein n=1 Tax=Streptomyces brasiliensis TaxID=1954 RepID=A0A917L2E1_9ACTN|nr:hypothetical protein [Streptomyces brasiliensis]GGJ38612.1 hypothetical protein GCM10010121_057180 [Streptomyces brasiliensis]
MATTERDQTAVDPENCAIDSLVMDIETGKIGVVMGHHGPDRVQLRPARGGREWDAFRVRRLTPREELSVRNDIRNAISRAGL